MYTKGIRKIFVPRDAGMPLDKAVVMADDAGYEAIAFNGVVYVKVADVWHSTVFHVTDFSDAND